MPNNFRWSPLTKYLGGIIVIGTSGIATGVGLQRINTNYKNKKIELELEKKQFNLPKEDA